MSDWEVVKINKKPKEDNQSDWEVSQAKNQGSHKNNTGLKGIGHDIYETFAEPVRHPVSSAIDALSGLVSETYGLGKQVTGLPFQTIKAAMSPIEELPNKIPRLTKNLAQGFENFVNTPANIAGYLGKKGIVFPEDIAERAHIKVNPFNMGEQREGDVFAQGIPSLAALGPLGEAGQLGNIGRTVARGAAGAGIGATQNQNPLQTALLNSTIPAIVAKTPGFTNKAIAKQLSQNKASAIEEARQNYNNWFQKTREVGADKIERPHIMAGDIVNHSQSKHHAALEKFLDDPTVENAHWAQSELGFLKRHLEKVGERQDLTPTQHNTLKNVIQAQNRIKQSMFNEENIKSKPELEQEYNQLAGDYAENVVPLKGLQELSDYENKKITRNNLIKKLLSNDEFMLGIGKKYPQIQINRALRSRPAKMIGKGILAGLGFEEGRKFIR